MIRFEIIAVGKTHSDGVLLPALFSGKPSLIDMLCIDRIGASPTLGQGKLDRNFARLVSRPVTAPPKPAEFHILKLCLPPSSRIHQNLPGKS